jgi:hypothetical protein
LLPALEFLDKEVVSLCDLAEFGVHAALEVDEILPSFQSIPGVLIPFSYDFIQMSHRNLGHEWLLDGSAKYSFHAGVSPL